MATKWDVKAKDQEQGKWKHRSVSALAKDIEAAVCVKAARWVRDRVHGKASRESLEKLIMSNETRPAVLQST